MTIRLTLLLLLTGLFAAAWSGDARHGEARRLARAQQASTLAVVRVEPDEQSEQSKRSTPRQPVVIELPPPPWEPEDVKVDWSAGPVLPAPPKIDRSASPVVTARPVAWQDTLAITVTEVDGLPLPTGIRPGTYRAVSNHGEVRQVQLTANQLGGASADGAEDLYIYRDGESRWYFVRLDAEAAADESESLPPAVAEYPSELIAERAARQTLLRIGRRLRAAAGSAMETGADHAPDISGRITSLRDWIGGLLPTAPAPMWSSRPAEAERR